MEAAHDRADGHVERLCRLGVAHAGDVDLRDGVAQGLGQAGDGGEHVAGHRGDLGVALPARRGVVLERVAADRGRHAALRAPVVAHDVAQRARQVVELAVAAQPAGARQHAGVGLLRQLVGEMRGAGQRPGEAVDAIEVLGGAVGSRGVVSGRGEAWRRESAYAVQAPHR